MVTGKYHIVYSWILLICFVAGQYMVYAHQHNITRRLGKTFSVSKSTSQQTFKEKCGLCDVMHRNVMIAGSLVYFIPVTAVDHVFKNVKYSFTSIQLILSGDRAPPVFNYES